MVAAALAVLAFLCGATAVVDMDYHWHVALGRNLLRDGFQKTEPLSHLPVPAPDRQAWLADAAFAVLDRIGGIAAIRTVLGVVYAMGVLSVFRLARRRAGSLAFALIPVAVYCALAAARLRVRPDVFSLALLPIFVELLERQGSWTRVAGLFGTAALWANLHPGALLAGFFSVAALFPFTASRGSGVVATWAGLCLTPDGLSGLLGFTADTTPLRPLIPEWQRLWERPFAEFQPEWCVVGFVAALVVVGAVASLRRLRTRAPSVSDGLNALLSAALAGTAVRFLFTLTFPALWAIAAASPRFAQRPVLRAAAASSAILIFSTVTAPPLLNSIHNISIAGPSILSADPPNFPSAAASHLAASELTGNLAHPARWGGYLAYRLSPRFRTATDGRVTHFGAALAHEFSTALDTPARESIFARHGIDIVVIPLELLTTFHDSEPYELLYVDDLAAILLRLDGPNSAHNAAVLKQEAKDRRRARGR